MKTSFFRKILFIYIFAILFSSLLIWYSQSQLTSYIYSNFLKNQHSSIGTQINSILKLKFNLFSNSSSQLASQIKNILQAKDVIILEPPSFSIISKTNISPLKLSTNFYEQVFFKDKKIFSLKKDVTLFYNTVNINNKTLCIISIFKNNKLKNKFLTIILPYQEYMALALIIIFIIFGITLFISYKIYKNKLEQTTNEDIALIEALAYQAENKESGIEKHLERTKHYIYHLAQHLKKYTKYRKILTQEYIENLVKASIVHDIGKVAVPQNILFKKGKLTEQEFEIIKEHCLYGAKIINIAKTKFPNSLFLKLAMEIILYHHERFDGTGYPKGLKAENIPLSARIMAIVDVYDTMRSKKCYKEPLEHEQCVQYILSERGKHFDPVLVDAFYSVERTFLKISLKFAESRDSLID